MKWFSFYFLFASIPPCLLPLRMCVFFRAGSRYMVRWPRSSSESIRARSPRLAGRVSDEEPDEKMNIHLVNAYECVINVNAACASGWSGGITHCNVSISSGSAYRFCVWCSVCRVGHAQTNNNNKPTKIEQTYKWKLSRTQLLWKASSRSSGDGNGTASYDRP